MALAVFHVPHSLDGGSELWSSAFGNVFPLSLKLTEVPLLLCDVPLLIFVSVGSALTQRRLGL